MKAETVASAFTLTGPDGAVVGVVTPNAAGNIATRFTFTPTNPLATITSYTASIDASVAQDYLNNALTESTANVWSFTTGYSPTHVSGTISADTTWDAAHSPYLLDSAVTIPQGVTLTVEPGTVVKGQCNQCYITVEGTLRADGTEAQPIVFTSYPDDAYGGDSNGDGNASTPAAGNWGGLAFAANSVGSLLDHVVVRYAGSGNNYVDGSYRNGGVYTGSSDLTVSASTISDSSIGIWVNNAAPTITGNVIERNGSYGIYLAGAGATAMLSGNTIRDNPNIGIYAGDGALPTITGNTFAGNGNGPIYLEGTSTGSPISGNTFTGGNGLNGIRVSGTLNQNTTWGSDAPYLLEGQVYIPAGLTLTVSPGAVVKGMSYSTNITVEGTLRADGTEAQPIVFTSYPDDAYGGDSNGDGNASTPAAGNWGGLAFAANSVGSLLDHVVVRYAGSGNNYVDGSYRNGGVYTGSSDLTVSASTISDSSIGIWVNNAAPTITGNVIERNNSYGIYLAGAGATAMLSGNTIRDNPNVGIYAGDGALPTITGNTFSGNANGPIYLSNTSTGASVSGNTFTDGGAINGIRVSGSLSQNTTWGADAPYLLESQVYIPPGVTLTVSPGAVVKGMSYSTNITVEGTLRADGTEAAPIVFTSYPDDAYGGDSNGDGNASTPAAGNWGGLAFAANSVGSLLDHVVVRYAGSGNNYVDGSYRNGGVYTGSSDLTVSASTISDSSIGIWVNNAAPTITGNVIERNNSYGIYLAGAGATAMISGNTIRDNGSGIFTTDSAAPSVTGGNILSGNTFNGIVVSGTLGVNTTWSADVPYLLTGQVLIPAGVTLTIEPGTVVKGQCNQCYITVEGTLRADGTEAAPIVFTSYPDDAYGGDSNGDGNASTPAAGNWGGLAFAANSVGSLLDHVVVRYAGSGNVYVDGRYSSADIYTGSSDLIVSASTISDSSQGVWIQNSAPTITGNVIERNNTGMVLYESSAFVIGNNIRDNTTYALSLQNNSHPPSSYNTRSGNGYEVDHMDTSSSYGEPVNCTTSIDSLLTPTGYDNVGGGLALYGQTFIATSTRFAGMRVFIGDPSRPSDEAVNHMVGPADLVLYQETAPGTLVEVSRHGFLAAGAVVEGEQDLLVAAPSTTIPGGRYFVAIDAADNYGIGLTDSTASTYADGSEAILSNGALTPSSTGRDFSFRVYSSCNTGALSHADLTVSALTAPLSAPSGGSVPVAWTVTNGGSGPTDASTWYDRVVLSPNDLYGDGDDMVLGVIRHDGALDIDATYTANQSIQLPAGLVGDYYVFVGTDEANAVVENVEDNNVRRANAVLTIAPIQHADLYASNVSGPTEGIAGQTFTVDWSVSNAGAGTTGDGTPDGTVANWMDRLVLSLNSIYGDGDDMLLAEVLHEGALAPSASSAGAWSGALPVGLSGTYHLFVFTDVGDQVYEQDDTNSNYAEAATTVIITPQPDLAPPDTSITSGPAEGAYLASTTAAFGWSGSDDVPGPLVYAWQMDGSAWTAFTSTTSAAFNNLTQGTHTFAVKARDQFGKEDPTPAVRNFIVDTEAPLPPSALNAAATSTGVELTWTHSPSPDVRTYRVYWDAGTGSIDYTTVYGSVTYPGRTFTASLTQQGTYRYAVRAMDQIGNEEHNTDVVAAIIVEGFGLTLDVGNTTYDRGQDVALSGTALDTASSPIANLAVTLDVESKGFRRTYTAYTDANGQYQYTFQPLSTEAGAFHVVASALHQGVTESVTADFNVLGLYAQTMNMAVNMSMNSTTTVNATFSNLGDIGLSNLQYELIDANTGDAISASVDTTVLPVMLAAGETVVVPVSITAPEGAPPTTPAVFTLRVTTAEGSVETTVITATLHEAVAVPVVTPSPLTAGLRNGETLVKPVTITNQGYAPMTGTTLTVADPTTYNWVTVVNGAPGTIGPQQAVTAQVHLAPPADLTLGTYTVQLNLAYGATVVPLYLTVEVTTSTVGQVAFKVHDDTGALVSGATASLISEAFYVNQTPSGTQEYNNVFQDVTDANGAVTLPDVPAGNYRYVVTAAGHDSKEGTLTVTPGTTPQDVPVVLVTNLVNVDFNVVPTTIQDQYTVTLNITYTTDLVKPTLYVNPSNVNLSFFPDHPQDGTLTVTNTSNNAPVRNVTLDATALDSALHEAEVRFSDGLTSEGVQLLNIGELAPGESRNIAYKATIPNASTAILDTRSLGNITISGEFTLSIDGEAVQSTTTTPVPVWYSKPQDLALPMIGFVNDETDGDLNDLEYQGTSYRLAITSNRDIQFDSLPLDTDGDTTPDSDVKAVTRFVGSAAVDILNQNDAIWATDFNNPHPLAFIGDALTFDVATFKSAMEQYLTDQRDTVLNVPHYVGVQGQWADRGYTDTYLIPVSITTVKEGVITISEPVPCSPSCNSGVGSGTTVPTVPMNTHGEVRLQIDQGVTLERQAFDASLSLTPTVGQLDNVQVVLSILDDQGNDASGLFSIIVAGQSGISSLAGGVITGAANIDWQLIPSSEAGGSQSMGLNYRIAAHITYDYAGSSHSFNTQEESVTVQPMPKLTVDYYLPYLVVTGKPVKLKVTASNDGAGAAHNLTLLSAQPNVVSNVNNLPINFTLDGSSPTPDPGNYQNGVLSIAFSDVPAGSAVEGYWQLTSTGDGYFVDFTSTLKHQDYQGVQLDPLILAANTHLVPAIGGHVFQEGCNFGAMTVEVWQGGVLMGSDPADANGAYFIPDLAAGEYLWRLRNGDGVVMHERTITVLANQPTALIDVSVNTDTLDTDNDTLGDCWELRYFPNLSQGPTGDYDGDGLTNKNEHDRGTDPTRVDTDGDGVSDGDEVAAYSDPLDPNNRPGQVPRLSLSGYVSDRSTGQLLDNVAVNVGSRQAATDQNGFYSLTELPETNYTVTVNLPGYGAYEATVDTRNVHYHNIVLTPDFSQCGTGMLSGKVTDAQSKTPLLGVVVSLDGQSPITTNELGEYSFNDVAPGVHTVQSNANNYTTYSRNLSLCGNENWDIGLVRPPYGLTPTTIYGDPVNTATGNYVYQRRDIEVSGRSMPFTFERTYNSQAATEANASTAPLGYGWTHNFNIFLSVDAGVVEIHWADGRLEKWAPDGAGGFTPQYGVFDTLIDNHNGTYSIRKKDLTFYHFDSNNRLALIVDKNGNAIQLSYSGTNLTQVIDTSGRVFQFAYDADDRITSVTDIIGRAIQFGYDTAGNLVSYTDRSGNVTSYVYDDAHQMLTVTDPRGNVVVTNTYDADRRVVTYQTDAKGGATSYVYDEAAHTTTITNALGHVLRHHYDDKYRLLQEDDERGFSTYFAYDDAGNRIRVIDKNGNVTQYAYDAAGNVTRKTDPLGNVTTITYDTNNNPLSRIDALGHVMTFTYDALGNLLTTTDAVGSTASVTYNASGQPLTLTDGLGRTTTNSYDPQGNLVQVQDALGNATQFVYDGVGRRLSSTDALGRITTYTPDNSDNLLILTDPAGNPTTVVYDGNNNRTRVTDRRGSVTEFAYDVKDLLETTTNALGHTVGNVYDALDRKISVTDPNGNATQLAYDPVGNLIGVTDALNNSSSNTYDPNGNLLTVTDALGHTSQFTYDALNRKVSVSDALGNTTVSEYDRLGRVVSTTNAKGQTTSFTYDAIGRLTRVTDAATGTVQYAYDAVGNRTTMTDPNGHVTTYAYDALNRLVTKTEPLGNTTQYQYDAVGNLTRLTKPNGTVIAYAYDDLNRLTTVTYPDSSTLSFAYDAEGNRTQMTDSVGTSHYAYDALGRMTQYTDPFGNVIGYGYDAAGNRTSLTYPGSRFVTYSYDALNRMTGVTDWLTRTTRYSYDAAGRLVGISNPNGTQTTLAHDNADRLTTLTNQKADTTNIASYAYTLDAIGNHSQETRDEPLAPVLTPGTRAYTYDNENRLTDENGVGNSFDANGNMTAKGSDTFAYDFEDRLTQSTVGGATAQYQYDGVGNRLTRTAGGATTRYVLDPNTKLTKVLAEADATNTISVYYVYGLGLVSRIEPDGTTRYYHYDSRGSTIALSDSTGAITDEYAYDAFGNVVNSTGTTANPFTYLGRYGLMAEGGGLYYVRARYYDAPTGRFFAKDPRAAEDTETMSINRYIYGVDNPIVMGDVDGEFAQILVGAGVGAIGGVISTVGWDVYKTVRTGRIHFSGMGYLGAITGGATSGACVAASAGVGTAYCVAAGAAVSNATMQVAEGVRSFARGQDVEQFNRTSYFTDIAISYVVGKAADKFSNSLKRPGGAPATNPITKYLSGSNTNYYWNRDTLESGYELATKAILEELFYPEIAEAVVGQAMTNANVPGGLRKEREATYKK